jgi:hypothetical protein
MQPLKRKELRTAVEVKAGKLLTACLVVVKGNVRLLRGDDDRMIRSSRNFRI